MGTPERVPSYGRLRLTPLCGRCTLRSPNIVKMPFSTSESQVCAVFRCQKCDVRGVFVTQIHEDVLMIFRWNPESPLVKLYLRGLLDEC